MTIIAAADGSALGNPGPAGWAWYVDDDCWHAGGWKESTNNRGELMAVLDLLNSTADAGEDLKVFCDSKYVINALTKWMPGWKRKGWKKADGKDVLNKDLLEQLDSALKGREVEFEWVKGHSNHAMNEAADDRARAAATAYQKNSTVPSGPGYVPAGTSESVTAPSAEDDLVAEEAPVAGSRRGHDLGLLSRPHSHRRRTRLPGTGSGNPPARILGRHHRSQFGE